MEKLNYDDISVLIDMYIDKLHSQFTEATKNKDYKKTKSCLDSIENLIDLKLDVLSLSFGRSINSIKRADKDKLAEVYEEDEDNE